jgi:NADH dehydrogenase
MTRSGATPAVLAVLAGGAALMFFARRLDRLSPSATHARRSRQPRSARPRYRVVVVGAGFGGLNAALRLAVEPDVDLTVIDSHNHHLFQPLLYQVATAALAPSDIASPLRGTISCTDHVRVRMGTVTAIDTTARRVEWDGGAIPYDELIIATGSKPSYFGHDGWERFAPGLKTLDDALELRRRILTAFERASLVHDDAKRESLLTFVLIGGGPTGVEMAGSIAGLARDLLAHDYDMPGRQARIVLVEAGHRILPEFAPDLSKNAAQGLRDLGVELRLGTRVTGIEAGQVHLHNQTTIAAETVIWAAGNAATPVADWLGVKPGHGGRVPVEADLSVAGLPEVHVIGDASFAVGSDGKPLPGLAPVAKQQGRFVARAILRRLRGGRGAPASFAYRDYGTLATIGRGKAVAEFGSVHLTGQLAWITWAVAHIFFLIGFRNRVMVSAQWAFAYATHERTDRLILGRLVEPSERRAHPPVAKPG